VNTEEGRNRGKREVEGEKKNIILGDRDKKYLLKLPREVIIVIAEANKAIHRLT
jgi:hypothetical protein